MSEGWGTCLPPAWEDTHIEPSLVGCLFMRLEVRVGWGKGDCGALLPLLPTPGLKPCAQSGEWGSR